MSEKCPSQVTLAKGLVVKCDWTPGGIFHDRDLHQGGIDTHFGNRVQVLWDSDNEDDEWERGRSLPERGN